MDRKSKSFSNFYDQYMKYDEFTDKSTCLVESCHRQVCGRKPYNIRRHYKSIHKIDLPPHKLKNKCVTDDIDKLDLSISIDKKIKGKRYNNFFYDQYMKYDAFTDKSTCLLESCRREVCGRKPYNIRRHYKFIHKIELPKHLPEMDFESDDNDVSQESNSTAWPWNTNNSADEPDDHDVEDEKSDDGSVSPALSLLQVKEDTDSPPPTPTPLAPIRISVAKKSAEKRTADVLQDISAQELHHSPQQIQLLPQHHEEPPRKSQRVNSISQHTIMKAFGHNVCIQLQDMDRRQRIIAEKLIADVLFHGKLGNLHETTSIALQRVDLQGACSNSFQDY